MQGKCCCTIHSEWPGLCVPFQYYNKWPGGTLTDLVIEEPPPEKKTTCTPISADQCFTKIQIVTVEETRSHLFYSVRWWCKLYNRCPATVYLSQESVSLHFPL